MCQYREHMRKSDTASNARTAIKYDDCIRSLVLGSREEEPRY